MVFHPHVQLGSFYLLVTTSIQHLDISYDVLRNRKEYKNVMFIFPQSQITIITISQS